MFHEALVSITKATLAPLGRYVARVVGAQAYQKIVEEFLAQDSQGLAAQTIGRRLPFVLQPAKGSRLRGCMSRHHST